VASTNPNSFAREATGFVREISTLSAFIANLSFINIALGILTYTTAAYVFPGSDPVVATVIATGFSICVSLMYTLLSWAMPRSGGDYIMVSRVLNPVVGFIANFNVTFWYVFFIGIATNWITTFSLAPAILTVGNLTGDQSLVSLANTLSHPQNIVAIGIVVIVFNVAIMMRGVRVTFTVNNVMFLFSMVGIGTVIWLLVTNTNADFVKAFSTYGNYNDILSAAHTSGYSPHGPNAIMATLGVMPFIFASTGYGIITSYFAGEVKSIKKNAFMSQVLSALVGGAMLAIIGALAINVFGYDFLGSITMLGTIGASQYPFSVPPYLNLFVSILTKNPTVLWLLAATLAAAIIISFLPTYMIATRNIFAWSFDRVIPIKFSSINDRTHSPAYAIGAVAILQFVGLIAYTYGPSAFLSLISGAGLAEIITFMIVALAAIVFPFKRKDLYENTSARINLGPVPLISIVSTISLAFYALLEYFYLSNVNYGANIMPVYGMTAVSLVLPAVIFAASYYYNKRRGLDLLLAFKGLPPE
jgi:amino acid transporter